MIQQVYIPYNLCTLDKLQTYAKKSIEIIRKEYGLPASGFLAGGSIANIITSLIWGEKYEINDIDVFYIEKRTNYSESNLFNFKKEENFYYTDYNGILHIDKKTKEYYQIVSSIDNGIFNYIYCESKDHNYKLIIDSFDLNCVKVGYNIEDDEYIISKDFLYFINNKIIRLTNLNTPYHTAIRLAKKMKTFNLSLNEIHEYQFKLIQHTIYYNLGGVIRTGFKNKYKEEFNNNLDILSNYFYLVDDIEKQERILEKYGINDKVYTLSVKLDNKETNINDLLEKNKIIDDSNLNNINTIRSLYIYMTFFQYSSKTKKLWNDLFFVRNNEFCIDDIEDISDDDIVLLKNISLKCVNSNNLLKDMSLIDRLNYIKMVINLFSNDLTFALLVLDNIILDDIDDFTVDLLKIKFRKNINYYKNHKSILEVYQKSI